MDGILITFSICFTFCFLLEGIETAFDNKANRIYKLTHILYPLFIIGTLFYLYVSGVVK